MRTLGTAKGGLRTKQIQTKKNESSTLEFFLKNEIAINVPRAVGNQAAKEAPSRHNRQAWETGSDCVCGVKC